ncbi:hypothetical protein NE237_021636 [Protea cynaroides]|uniref:WRKY domain-containing protein n=1 Tax=Protea cynaroides TaxID=273540 RepID=A0A9Q0K3G3_9MAGN|nr:hypothetical protein NE237_021636 [Protea cynaroides]
MEATLKRSSGFGSMIEERRRLQFNGDDDDDESSGKIAKVLMVERTSMDSTSKASSSMKKDQADQLESARAEMGKVKEENEILKITLSQVMNEYRSLQMHLTNLIQQEEPKKSMDTAPTNQEIEEPEISLSLGRVSSEPKKDEKSSCNSSKDRKDDQQLKEGLALRLDCKFEGSSNPSSNELPSIPDPETSFEEPKNEEAAQTWPPSKSLKTMRSGDDEASQQIQVKKARVSVRARCDTPTMNDGCQWRKYGQKIAKGNPCPRAYYRCTVAPACPVRKQVQRCAEDMSILITTYEGNHNHPLPMSATAMASTTSAAASMLMSGSSTSESALGASATNTASADFHGLNFNLSDNTRSRQFYLPNSSISSSPSYPTITLDLTAPPSSSSSSSAAAAAAASQFNRLNSNFHSTPRYSTSFNFSSSESNTLPTSWPGTNGYLSYGNQSYNKSHIGSLSLGKQPQEHFYQPYMQKNNPTPPQQAMSETIAAATKAITADPSFRSVLEAAITSIVNKGSTSTGENFGQNLKWDSSLRRTSLTPSLLHNKLGSCQTNNVQARCLLGDMIETLASKSVHSVYVVASEEDEVVGAITLIQVISCYLCEVLVLASSNT